MNSPEAHEARSLILELERKVWKRSLLPTCQENCTPEAHEAATPQKRELRKKDLLFNIHLYYPELGSLGRLAMGAKPPRS